MEHGTATLDRLERVLRRLAADSSGPASPGAASPGAAAPGAASPVGEFARLLLARAPADYFDEFSADEIGAEVKNVFGLLEETGRDEISVRVRSLGEGARTVLETVMPDCSFIVNTLREYAHGRDLEIAHLLHPVLVPRRAADGRITGIEGRGAAGGATSVVYLVLEDLQPEARTELEAAVAQRLEKVRVVNADFHAMLARSAETVAELEREKREMPWRADELQETQDLLAWLDDGNYVFLGYRSYDLTTDPDGERWIRLVPDSGLGILRDERDSTFRQRRKVSELPPALRARALGGPPLIVSKTNAESPIHRRSRMDYIGLKRFGSDGEISGERRFLGLFTSKAYNQDPSEIPILRRKLREILEAEGAAKGSHDYRIIFDFFGSMPIEELFLASVAELSALLSEILEAEGADEVRVTARPDPLARGVNVMVVLPKERFSGEARQRIQEALVSAYGGTLLNYHLALGEGDQARLHFYVAADPVDVSGVDLGALEREVHESVRTWKERLSGCLREVHGLEEARRLEERHMEGFSAEYEAAVRPEVALADIARLEMLLDSGRPQIVFEELAEPRPHAIGLKVFAPKGRLVLSDAMPVLENFGFRVIQADKFEVGAPGGPCHTIHTFEVETPPEWAFDPQETEPRIQRAVWAIIGRQTESDALSSLVLSAGLDWREVAVLRAYAGYAFRCGAASSRTGVREPLVRHPEAARILVSLFRARFDPERAGDAETWERLLAYFEEALGSVRSIEHDRTLRRLLALLTATVRTNFFQPRTRRPRGTIALKLEPSRLDFLPRPRPRVEVYVNSPHTEGAHLRMDLVARGGIRWSDRYEDFRVEVLGLVKTQQVKNALIVPAGAKGAFIVKGPLPPGVDQREAAVESYKEFIGSLLDLSDDLRDGELRHPSGVVRLDGDDPYLVVAADKGTATLSDTANELAAARGYWLGDAFASGGSRGYDHKELGITAKGAWECVRRHFRELGKDIQKEPVTVAGIGDMSGDVFGNGMLLSRQIRLVAAFDHRHIFLDPSPDPERSWEERKRLFETPGSSWTDYDRALLSEGGGVFERGAKRIDLSPQASVALGLAGSDGPGPPDEPEPPDGPGPPDEPEPPDGLEPPDGPGPPDEPGPPLNGEELVRAILRAPVDLLWNGGIGSYVKAGAETHADVGDPANAGVRIDAGELRARVVGEGGNLGLTQRARVEYALGGGRINTDAIDNSGGVDLSDHEVNLKILLNPLTRTGSLDEEGRVELLREVAADVVEDVLDNSRSQSLALGLDERRARAAPDEFHYAQLQLERAGLLDPALEHLPESDQYWERIDAGAFLTRPELATLLAHAKMHLKAEIQRSRLADDPALVELLRAYFPARALAAGDGETSSSAGTNGSERAGHGLLATHPLRARLIATELTNRFVDTMGSTTHLRLARETGRPGWEIARAWYAASEIAEACELQERLGSLAAEVPAGVLYGWHLSLSGVLERCILWILGNCDPSWSSERIIDWLGNPVGRLRAALPEILPVAQLGDLQARQSLHETDGLPTMLAGHLGTVEMLDELLPAARLARVTGVDATAVGRVYFALAEMVGYHWLRERLERLPGEDPWAQRAAGTMRTELDQAVSQMAMEVLTDLTAAAGRVEGAAGEPAAAARLEVVAAEPPAAPVSEVVRALDEFRARHGLRLERIRRVLDDARSMDEPSLPALLVAVHAVRIPLG